MAPSSRLYISCFVLLSIFVLQSEQHKCWEDIPIKQENAASCTGCPKPDEVPELLFERVEKSRQLKVDLNCMVADITGWNKTVETYSWVCKQAAKGCTKRLAMYNWTALADSTAKEGPVNTTGEEFKKIGAEILLLKNCAPKTPCEGSTSSKSAADFRKEAQKMASALFCATDTSSGGSGIAVTGFTFKQPVGVAELISPCTDVTTLYAGTDIKTEAFVNETKDKLEEVLSNMYKSSYCDMDYLCPCGDAQLTSEITGIVKSVKCTDSGVGTAASNRSLNALDQLLADSDFKYTATCASTEQPSNKARVIDKAKEDVTILLDTWKSAKVLCACHAKRRTGEKGLTDVIGSLAQEATCANKDLSDKTAAKPDMDGIKTVTDALKLTTNESTCPAASGTDADRNTKIKKIAKRVTKLNKQIYTLAQCPCKKDASKVDKNVVKEAKFEANCWFKKIAAPTDPLKAEKTKVDELVKKLRKDWEAVLKTDDQDDAMKKLSECKENKDTITDSDVLQKIKDIYARLEASSKRDKMLKDCPCNIRSALDISWLYEKIESIAKVATCTNKDLTDKNPATTDMTKIKGVTDDLLMTVTEDGCPAASGTDAEKLAIISKVAERIALHNTQLSDSLKCPCKKTSGGCPCKVIMVNSAIRFYDQVAKRSNQAYCVDDAVETTAHADVKAAWANVMANTELYLITVDKKCPPSDPSATVATNEDKVEAIAAVVVELNDQKSMIKTIEDASISGDPLGQFFEKSYTKSLIKLELNCMASELGNAAFTGTVSDYTWLCSSVVKNCPAILTKDSWASKDAAAKLAFLSQQDTLYKTLTSDVGTLSCCNAPASACSSGKSQLETKSTEEMKAEATKMASALKCATDTGNSGVTVTGYTFVQPVAVPILKTCADATTDYTGVTIKSEAFVNDTRPKLAAQLEDLYEVSYCRGDRQCQCCSTEAQTNIDNLVKTIKCTNAATDNPGATKRMEALDAYLYSADYKVTVKCSAGETPTNKSNLINEVLQKLPTLVSTWKPIGELCSCKEKKDNDQTATEKVIEILAQEAKCQNKALTLKTGALANMTEILTVTTALKLTITEAPCTAAIITAINAVTADDAAKTSKISSLADKITALFTGYKNIAVCPCNKEAEMDAMKNYAESEVRKANCAKENLDTPAQATAFTTQKTKIDNLAKELKIEPEGVVKCEKVTTSDADLTTQVTTIATNLQTISDKAKQLKECPCTSTKEQNDITLYNKVGLFAQQAVCLNNELSTSEKIPVATEIAAVKTITDGLLMTVSDTSCQTTTLTVAKKTEKIKDAAKRVEMFNTELEWVRKCPCKKSDKEEYKNCENKNAVIKELLEQYNDVVTILQKANCIVPDLSSANATVKTAMGEITKITDGYVITAGRQCEPGYTAADQVAALKVLEDKLKALKFKVDFNEESVLARDCTVSQFYQKENRRKQLKSSMNCVAMALRNLTTTPWAGTIATNSWLCEKSAKDCTEWLAKYDYASKADDAAKTAVLTVLENDYKTVLKQIKILDESTAKLRCKRGTQYLQTKSTTELYKEVQLMQSALKCTTLTGHTFVEKQAIPFLITCSEVTTAYTAKSKDINTQPVVTELTAQLQKDLKTYLEVAACRLDGVCPCDRSEIQVTLTACVKAVKCTTTSETNSLATSRLKKLDELLEAYDFPYSEKCANGENPSIVPGDIDDVIDRANKALPTYKLLGDVCPCRKQRKSSEEKLTQVIESYAKKATCYHKDLADKTPATPKMADIKNITDTLSLTITETGCPISTINDTTRLAMITKLAERVTNLGSQRATIKKCPCKKLAGRKTRDINGVLSRLKRQADCREKDLDTASDAGFKTQKDKIDELAKKYDLEADDDLECVPDTTSTDAELTTKVTEIYTKMEKLGTTLDDMKPCFPCKLNEALNDLKLYNKLEGAAQKAICNNKDLTTKATATMDEIKALTDSLFMTVEETGCTGTTPGNDTIRLDVIQNTATRVMVYNTQLKNARDCPCPVDEGNPTNSCPCKVEKVKSIVKGYDEVAELLQKAKCIEPNDTLDVGQLKTAVDSLKPYSERYGVTVRNKCIFTSTADDSDKKSQIEAVEQELETLDKKIKEEEECPCPAEAGDFTKASETKLADYFFKAKCIGETYKTDTTVTGLLKEIDDDIEAQMVDYTKDCTGFTNPATDPANAAVLMKKEQEKIKTEVTKIDTIEKCSRLPTECRALSRPFFIDLSPNLERSVTSPGFNQEIDVKHKIKCLWKVTWTESQELTYSSQGVDITTNSASRCGDNKLTAKTTTDSTSHCTGLDLAETKLKEGPLSVSYVNNGDMSTGKGFTMSLKPSYQGCGDEAKVIEIKKAEDFSIESPLLLGKYPNNLNCTFIVKFDPEFYTVAYQTESTPQINSTDNTCGQDVLKITDKGNATATLVCQTTEVAETETTSGELTLNFVTDATEIGSGFKMNFSAKYKYPDACKPDATGPEVINITTASVNRDVKAFTPEGMYLKNAKCQWKIIYDPNKFIIDYKTVGPFDIKSESCVKDKLEIANTTTKPADMSPHCVSTKIDGVKEDPNASGVLWVDFTANNDTDVGTGFQLVITASYNLPPECAPETAGKQPPREIVDETPVFMRSWGSKHGFNYGPNHNCTYPQIKWDPQLWVVMYETNETMSIHALNDSICATDYLKVKTGDGNTTKYCGDKDISQTNVTGKGSLDVSFFSDNNITTTGKGFVLKVWAVRRELSEGCSYDDQPDTLNQVDFRHPRAVSLTSVDRKKSLKYIPGYNCTWNVTYNKENMDLILSTKGSVALKSGQAGCSKDNLKIKDGVAGTPTCVTAAITKQVADEDTLEITHASNGDAEVDLGFELVLTAVPQGCGKPEKKELKTGGRTTYKFYLNNTSGYIPNLSCLWELEYNKNELDVNYTMARVDINGSPAGTCTTGDKFTLEDGSTTTQVCGRNDVAPTPVESGKLKGTFTSNADDQVGEGFLFTLITVYKACQPGLKTPVAFTEPGEEEVVFYGKAYEESLTCEWKYTSDRSEFALSVAFPTLGVTGTSPACATDKIETDDSGTKTSYCGSTAVTAVPVSSGNLTVTFTSDATPAADGTGFKMVVKAEYLACVNGTVTELTELGTTVRRFYHPSNYTKDLNCTMTYKWNAQTLVVKSTLKELGTSTTDTSCTDDYLEMTVKDKPPTKMCGTPTPAEKQPVEMDSGEVSYNFISNSDDNIGTGFVLELEVEKRGLPKACTEGGDSKELKFPGNVTIKSLDRGKSLPYIADLNCTTKVTWDPARLSVSVLTVGDVEIISADNTCADDYLELQDGPSGNKTKYCQTSKIDPAVEMKSGELIVAFVTNASVVGSGFKLAVVAGLPQECSGGNKTIELTSPTVHNIKALAPAAGEDYFGGLSCKYIIKWEGQKYDMELKSVSMNLKDTTCSNEYLEINCTGVTSIKVCGTTAIPATKLGRVGYCIVTIVTANNANARRRRSTQTTANLNIQFTTSQRQLPQECSVGGRPEVIEIKQPGNTTFESLDKGVPLPYPNDLNCTRTIKWDPARLDVKVTTVGDVEIISADNTCADDYLELQDGASGNKTKYCQTSKIDPAVEMKSGELMVAFVSNASVVGSGYELAVVAEIPKECSGGNKTTELTSATVHNIEALSPAAGEDYFGGLSCIYIIKWEGQKYDMELKSVSMNLKDTTCSNEYLEINCTGVTSIKVCGTTAIPAKKLGRVGYCIVTIVTANNNANARRRRSTQTTANLKIQFTTSQRQLPQECSDSSRPKVIEIKQPGNTTFESLDKGVPLPYPNDLNCTRTIKWDPARLDVKVMTVGDVEIISGDNTCADDYLELQDGASGNKTKYCQTSKIDPAIEMKSGELMVAFVSNPSVVGSGYELAVVAEIPKECSGGNRTTELTSATVHNIEALSPAAGEDYFGGLSCIYIIKWDGQKYDVELKSVSMNIKDTTCSNEYLEINCTGLTSIKVCGTTTIPATKLGRVGYCIVHFVSADNANARRRRRSAQTANFKVQITTSQRKLPQECRDGDRPKVIEIKQPGNTTIESLDKEVPLPYIDDLNCTRTIKWDPERLNVKVATVGDVEIISADNTCADDYLELQDGASGNKTKYCQTSKIDPAVEMKSGELMVAFVSNPSVVGSGYELAVMAELPEECNGGSKKYEITELKPLTFSTWARADGENYIGGLRCKYEVKWDKNRFAMTLKSLSMDVQDTGNCPNDYVEIKCRSANAVKKCGTAAIGQMNLKTVDSCNITFVSDNDQTTVAKGVKLFFKPGKRSLPEGCSYGKECTNPKKIVIPDAGRNYTFKSLDRGDADTYPPDICCQYEYTWASDSMDVRYGYTNEFQTGVVGETPCDKDYVGITDGDGDEAKVCGKEDYPATLTNITTAKSNKLVVKFVTDNDTATVYKGFELQVQSVELAACSNDRPKKIQGHLGDDFNLLTPGFLSGKYGNNKNCSWEIELPQNGSLLIRMVEVDIEASTGCTKDYLQVSVDGNIMGTVCDKYSAPRGNSTGSNGGNNNGRAKRNTSRWIRAAGAADAYGNPFNYPTVKGNKVDVNFVTDAQNVAKGAKIRLQIVSLRGPCDGVVKNITMDANNKQLILMSPEYQHKTPLHSNQTCEWAIQFDTTKHSITCGFMDELEISADANTACPADKLELKDGAEAAQTVCAQKTYGTDINALDMAYTAETEMSVKLTTVSARKRGFKLVCNLLGAIPPACKGQVQVIEPKANEDTYVRSPGYPDNLPYQNNLTCTWTIVPGGKKIVFVGDGEQDLEGTAPACRKDTVEILEPQRGTDVDKSVKVCGKKTYTRGTNNELFVARYNGNITVKFNSNANTNGRGFSILLKRESCPADCFGVCGGQARVLCGNNTNCIDGITGKNETMAEFQSVLDCNKNCIINGTAENAADSCGGCVKASMIPTWPLGAPYKTCDGECHTAFAFSTNGTDVAKNSSFTCNTCIYGKTSKVLSDVKDACGVCGGDNSTCLDCADVPNGGKKNDACTVCGGDGSTCKNVPNKVIPDLIPSAKDLTIKIEGAGFIEGKVKEVVIKDSANTETVLQATVTDNQNLNTVSFRLAAAGVYSVYTKTDTNTLSTATLTLTVYDSGAEKAVSIAPTEETISDAAKTYTFTVTTVGVQNRSSIVCVFEGLVGAVPEGSRGPTSNSHYMVPAKFRSATETVCEVNMAIPSSREVKLFVSLNGGYHDLTKIFTFTIFAPAPSVTASKFSNNGAALLIDFDISVETKDLKITTDMFDASSATKLGTGDIKLIWINVKSLKINIGKGAGLVETGNTLTIKDNTIKSFGQAFSKSFSGTATVAAPTAANTPNAVLTGAIEAAKCDVFKFSSLESTGACGRPFKSVAFVISLADTTALTTDKYNKMDGVITFNGSVVDNNSKVKLTVTNFLDGSNEIEITLKVADNPVPKVALSSSLGVTGLTRKDSITVMPSAEMPAGSCVVDGDMKFTWSFPGDLSLLDGNQEKANSYIMKAFKYPVRAVRINVVLSIGTSTDTVSQELTLTFVAQDLVAIIRGAPSKVGAAGDPLTLSGSQSSDPDRIVSISMSYEWRCTTISGPCSTKDDTKLGAGRKSTYIFEPSKMIPNTKYTIKLTVTKGSRTSETSVEINVVAGDPPVLECKSAKVKDSDRPVKLKCKAKSKDPITSATWKSLDESSKGFPSAVAGIKNSWKSEKARKRKKKYIVTYKMKIPKYTLNPGATYTFRLGVFTAGSDASALVEFATTPIVTGCVLEAADYTAADDITLKVIECVADKNLRPLTYQFGTVVDGDDRVITEKVNSPSTDLLGPMGDKNGKMTVFVTVCDKNEKCFSFRIEVTATPLQATQANLDDLIARRTAATDKCMAVADFIGTFLELARYNPFIQRLSKEILASQGRRKREVAQTDSGVALALMMLGNILKGTLDKAKIALAASQLETMDVNQMTAADQKKFGGLIGDLLKAGATEGISKTGVRIALKSAQSLVTVKALTETEMATIQANANKGLFKNGPLTEPIVIDDGNSISTTLMSDLDDDVSVGLSGRKVNVKFPDDLQAKYGDWLCLDPVRCDEVGVSVNQFYKVGYTRSNEPAVDERSTDIVDVAFNNPKTGDPIEVKDLPTPIEISIPPLAGKTCDRHICKYEDKTTNTWKMDGVTFDKCMDGKVVCKTTHLSSFMAVKDPSTTTTTTLATTTAGDGTSTKTEDGDAAGGTTSMTTTIRVNLSSQDNTGAIIGGVIGGILAALLVGMFIFFICRIQQRDVIKVDHIEMGKPSSYAYDNAQYSHHGDESARRGQGREQAVHI